MLSQSINAVFANVIAVAIDRVVVAAVVAGRLHRYLTLPLAMTRGMQWGQMRKTMLEKHPLSEHLSPTGISLRFGLVPATVSPHRSCPSCFFSS